LLRFEVPDDAPPTCLRELEARYWELVVESHAPHRAFEGAYLVPIYAKE